MVVRQAEYHVPDAEAIIVVDEGPFAGAEITVRTHVGYGVVRRARQWHRAFFDAPGGSDDEDDALTAAYSVFVEHGLIAWNLHDHLGPIPTTVEAMVERLHVALGLKLVVEWLRSIGEIPFPLAERSPSTAPSQEPGTRPVVPTSQNRRSSTTPSSTDGSSTEGSSPPRSTERTPTDSSAPFDSPASSPDPAPPSASTPEPTTT